MKNKRLISRLNYVHITHFGFVLVLLFFIIFFIHRIIKEKDELKALENYCILLDTNLNSVPSTSIPIDSLGWQKYIQIVSNNDIKRSVIIYDKNNQILAQSDHSLQINNPKSLFQKEESSSSKYAFSYGLNAYKKVRIEGEQFHSYSIENKRLNIHLSVFQPVNSNLKSFDVTMKVVLICFILAFLLCAIMIKLTNYQLIHSFNELILSIKNNKYSNLSFTKNESETNIIRKYLDILENRIDFYEKKIENISFERKGLENDLKLANRLQKNLFPANTLSFADQKKFDICAYSMSAYEVGGDLYDCFLIDEDHLLVAVADVAGKGIAASLFMIYTHTLLRSLVKPGVKVTLIVQLLNNQLIEENISDMFVTLFLGVLTLSDGKFEYCNAAHTLPCMITATGNVYELSETHGIPIGIYPNRVYQSTTITLNDGDQIFIYTDGLTDSIDENGIKYSSDVLRYNLMGAWFNNATEVTERIKNSIEYFRGTNKPVDDMTLLTVKYTPGNQVPQEPL
jgi:serine phosphatase RsbU (regulator of sigma subunit)